MKTDLVNLMQTAITQGWANQSDGDVESPTGYFARVEIGADWEEMRDALEYDGDKPKDGHYCVVEDSNGSVWIDGPYGEIYAEQWFARNEAAYGVWLGIEEDED